MEVEKRSVFEVEVTTSRKYDNPFIDVELNGVFRSPSGKVHVVPGFYDGDSSWRIRFSPDEPGEWSYTPSTQVHDPELSMEGRFSVVEPRKPLKGFMKTCPGEYWGLRYESGEPCFIWGDTMYNLFGVAYCGLDYETVLKRRAAQGFNLIRVRIPVSPFHPPEGYSDWQTRSTWPWGGSSQSPLFNRFNLEYFKTVDKVMRFAESTGIGFEIIIEAWGFEYPFNNRNHFTAEHEELWMRYLIARYDAFKCVYCWTLMNEYEYYPAGHRPSRPNLEADLWAVRTARFVKSIAPHGHPVTVHVFTPSLPSDLPAVQRFLRAPDAVDLIMFQHWGDRAIDRAWLAAGIEEAFFSFFEGWQGSFVFSEYGYERNPALELKIPSHEFMSPEHTRRAAWRGVFSASGVIHGFENTWGPWWIPEKDQEGMRYLSILKEFVTGMVEFYHFKPASFLLDPDRDYSFGESPLILATEKEDKILIYLPVGGVVSFVLSSDSEFNGRWYDPRTGNTTPIKDKLAGNRIQLKAPSSGTSDWVLELERNL